MVLRKSDTLSKSREREREQVNGGVCTFVSTRDGCVCVYVCVHKFISRHFPCSLKKEENHNINKKKIEITKRQSINRNEGNKHNQKRSRDTQQTAEAAAAAAFHQKQINSTNSHTIF